MPQIQPKELTPEEIEAERIANEEAQAQREAERAQKEAERVKRQEIKELYESISDPHYGAAKLGEGKTNPAEYLKEALESLDDTKLKALKKAFDDDKTKLEDDDKQSKVEELLAQIPYHMLDASVLANAKVVKYFQKKTQLVNKLKQKLNL